MICSDAYLLRLYQDEAGVRSPRPFICSAPIGKRHLVTNVLTYFALGDCPCKQLSFPPEEPFIQELTGEDCLEFPPPADLPLEEDAVIPGRVIDQLLDAPDHIVTASLKDVRMPPSEITCRIVADCLRTAYSKID